MTTGSADTIEKLIELLIVAAPRVKRIAVIKNPVASTHAPLMLQVEAAARRTGRAVLAVGVSTPEDIERGFANMVRDQYDAVIILPDSFLLSQRTHIAALAVRHKMPSINALSGYAEAGGLMSYGADINENLRRAGIFVDKILKGTKPGDIPFEQPTRYHLIINLKTAKELGLKIPQSLLISATRVIE